MTVNEAVRIENYKIESENSDFTILENKNALPRFYFVESIIRVESTEQLEEIIYDRKFPFIDNYFNPSSTALVEDGSQLDDFDFTGAREAVLEVISDKNNSLMLTCKSSGDNFLVISELYSKNNRAYLDGEQIPIYRVNGIVSGIKLPDGQHEIIIKFYDRNQILLITFICLNLLCALAGIAIIICQFYQRKKSRADKEYN